MANGLLGRIASGIKGLIENPAVQGIAGASLAGINPLFGLLAAPGIRKSRERRELDNEATRNAITAQNRQLAAQERLPGLLNTFVPTDRLLDVEGGPATSLIDLAPSAAPGVRAGVPGVTPFGSVPATATPGGNAQFVGSLLDIAPGITATNLLSPQTQDIPNDIKLLAAGGIDPRSPTGREAILRAVGGQGTTINVGDNKLDQPIPISSLDDIRLPDGGKLPIGTTFRQAQTAGATVLSLNEQNKDEQASAAISILDELEGLAVGPDSIFSNVSSGAVNRFGSAIDFALELVTQDDPRVSRFKDLSEGSISSFVRMLGERGALAEGDVSRALGLLPRLFPLPDTQDVAQDKLKDLREILERGLQNFNESSAGTQSAASDVLGTVTTAGSDALSDSGEFLSGAADRARQIGSQALSTASDLGSTIIENAPGVASQVAQSAQELGAEGVERGRSLVDSASQRVNRGLADLTVLANTVRSRGDELLSGEQANRARREILSVMNQVQLTQDQRDQLDDIVDNIQTISADGLLEARNILESAVDVTQQRVNEVRNMTDEELLRALGIN